MDSDETDTDCGGSCGATCKDGQTCKSSTGLDCVSGVCKSGRCAAPTCTDGVQNGNETDKDCGGGGFNGKPACPTCADQKACLKNSDCKNNICFGTPLVCVSCMDGQKDGNETDTDCGGPACDQQNKQCATGKACQKAADCKTDYCPSGTCALLPDGMACTTNAQCLNNACITLSSGGKVCCHTTCAAQPASSCGIDGSCTADGTACELYPSGTACSSACTGSTLDQKVCDGTGVCQDGTGTPCPNHLVCAGAACAKACGKNDGTGDVNCVAGFWCDGVGPGACQPTEHSGQPCNRDRQCPGMCNNGQHKCK
jgi:hypothetical protein